MPRVGAGKVDYNLAMDPALKEAGKICAAAEGRDLATLLRFLLRQHIERHGEEEAKHIYATGAQIPHGTRIDRYGKKKQVLVTLPGEVFTRAQSQANWEERSMPSLMQRALERYLDEARSNPDLAAPEVDSTDENLAAEEDDVSRNHRGEPDMF